MREDAEKMDENKKKDTLKRMGEMADLNAIRQIKECLLKNEKGRYQRNGSKLYDDFSKMIH